MMNILLLCDDEYHPGQVPIDGVKPLADKGYKIDIISNGNDFSPKILQNYQVVILSKADHVTQANLTSWKSPAVQQAFVDYVENGGGLIISHSAIVAGKNTAVLDRLAGCTFKYHPAQTPVYAEPLKPHPIMEGVEAFTETDEHYQVNILANDIDILMAAHAPAQGATEKYDTEPYTNAPQKIAPCVFARAQGNGRVCVITPGHNLNVWLNPNFQRLLENAIQWCVTT